MNPDIERLVQLQTVDSKIEEIRRELAKIPKRHQDILAQLEDLRKLTVNRQEEIRELEKQGRAGEREVESLREKERRLRNQQLEVKTNKEYHAILAEIDFVQKDISGKEDGILEMMEQAEQLKLSFAAARQKFDLEDERCKREIKAMEDSQVFLEDELAVRRRQREEIASQFTGQLLALYNRLAPSLGGVVVSEARQEICQMCHVRLRPQVFQELRMTETIYQCENCLRILYFRGDSSTGGQ